MAEPSGAPCTEEEYQAMCAYIDKYEDGKKPPSEEELMSTYDDSRYTDEKIWEDICKEGCVGEQKPDLNKILSKAKESIVLVDDIPTTNRDKIEKLKKKIEETFNKVKASKNASFVVKDKFFPFLEDKEQNEPYCLVQLENEQQAREFDRYVKNHKFTKTSTFKTYNLATIDKYMNSPDEWVD